MLARDVMTTNVITVTPDTPVEEIARTLVTWRISGVPVVEADGGIVGIVSEGDLMRRTESGTEPYASWWLAGFFNPESADARYKKSKGKVAREVMTTDVTTVDDETKVAKIAELLERREIKRVPVTRDGKLVGIVSRANLLHGLVTTAPAEAVMPDDQAIRTSILKTLHSRGGTNDMLVNVTVSEGVVHLWGTVASEREKQAIRAAAEEASGVSGVEDHLNIFPSAIRALRR